MSSLHNAADTKTSDFALHFAANARAQPKHCTFLRFFENQPIAAVTPMIARLTLLISMLLILGQGTAALAQNTLLWEVSGKGMGKPSYLYGTFHSHDARAHEFGDSVLVKLLQCDGFVGEITGMQESISEADAMRMARMEGMTLKELLKKKDYQRVKEFARKKLGFLALLINRLKPMFTMTLLAEFDMSPDMPYTVDDYLERLALERGLEVISLETINEQLDAFDAIPLEEQGKMLVDYVKNAKKAETDNERMVEMYRTQKMDDFYKWYSKSAYKSDGSFDRELLFKRNHVMAQRVDSMLATKSLFVGVGALHLPGPDGLIDLMRKRGYTLNPVFSSYHEGNRLPLIGPKEEWIAFAPEGANYQLLFPGLPDEDATADFPSYAFTEDLVTFEVSQKTLPKTAMQARALGLDPLEAIKLAFAKDTLLTLRESKRVTVGDYEVLQTDFDAPDGQESRTRLLIQGDAMVLFAISGPVGTIRSAAAQRFLESLAPAPAKTE